MENKEKEIVKVGNVPDKAIEKRKIYSIEFIHYRDGSHGMIRHNDGFETFELIGHLQFALREIQNQVDDMYQPADYIERSFVREPIKPEADGK